MTKINAHIINHTHWDREWFLTSVYTSRWIPGLIEKLERLASENPDFRFLFDGQTLVVEDLLAVAPGYEERVRRLVSNGRLQIGPYYCQPDWQLTSGELLIRNLMYGQKDVARFGGKMNTGWMVDTFGHISQSPQIHRLFGIQSIFVWRGVPQLTPYFNWRGADGTQMLTINLFGGYRNLYGVSHAPQVAVKRLESEVDKLRPYYPTPDIPLFDGYDLEDNPEDPLRFYDELGGVCPTLNLLESTPDRFAAVIANKQLTLTTLRGELNSGKYGATFPGVFSARVYQKVMAHDCEHLLFQICEPLGVLAHLRGQTYDVAKYEKWARLLLQNAVHDCICGVSIDQVHEKMEFSYRQVFDALIADAQSSLAAVLSDFAPGDYVVSSNPFAVDNWQIVGDEMLHVQTHGVGVWPVSERIPTIKSNAAVDSFTWRNEYYEATISADGLVRVDEAVCGELVVSAERGDTYSDELGDYLGTLQVISGLTLVEDSAHHAMVTFSGVWRDGERKATATVCLTFDETPLLKWQIDLDSRGSDLRVEMVFKTAVGGQIAGGQITAGMPFDNVLRPIVDDNLLPRDLPPELRSMLLGQRELNSVSMFPFHDFVAVADGKTAVAVLAKGLRGYRATANGDIVLPLRRAVEWLTAANLENRVGDAGPFFYVPDARCERVVRHEVAVAFGLDTVDSVVFQALNAAYQNPPLLVANRAEGSRKSWQLTTYRLLQEDVPLSGLHVQDGVVLARFYNPTSEQRPFSQTYTTTDVWGQETGRANNIAPKQIVTVQIESDDLEKVMKNPIALTSVAKLPAWRVGLNKGRPDSVVLAELVNKVAVLEEKIAALDVKTAVAQGEELLRLQHRSYVLQRECLEFQLSLLLNQRKLAQNGALNEDYLYHPDAEIAQLGLALNHLRIKRRIFDYVVEAL
ncbi:MAG: hypothetical protein KDE48_07815 [Anaerolineales bacterium]|nr:hypothetical protein [Anaerolineales bacterium]